MDDRDLGAQTIFPIQIFLKASAIKGCDDGIRVGEWRISDSNR
jgi:hypothetical protein